MPRKPRRPKKKTGYMQLTNPQLGILLYGSDFFNEKGFKNEEETRKAYFRFKDQVFSHQGLFNTPYHFEWGSRPWGWWRYEWPKLGLPSRKQTSGKPIKPISTELYFGTPAHWERYISGVEFESEFEYLLRNNLLLPGEKDKYFEQEAQKDRERSIFRKKMIGKNDI